MAHKKPKALHYCGMCSESFTSKTSYQNHAQNHQESAATTLLCQVCNFPFPDSLALEKHKIISGHSDQRYPCANCDDQFATHRGLHDHMRPPGCSKAPASSAQSSLPARPLHLHPPVAQQNRPVRPPPPVTCDRCATTFGTRQEYNKHRSFQANTSCSDHNHKAPAKNRVGFVDPDKPKDANNDLQSALGYGSSSTSDGGLSSESDAPTNMTDDAHWCEQCKNKFPSMAQFNNHFLRCNTQQPRSQTLKQVAAVKQIPVIPDSRESIQPSLSTSKKQRLAGHAPAPKAQHQLPVQPPARPSPTPSATTSGTGEFPCSVKACGKVSRSEAGLKVHLQDVHGIGGKAKDFDGKDAWMLSQSTRNERRQNGLLQPPPSGPSRGRGSGGRVPSGPNRPPPSSSVIRPPVAPQSIPAFRPLPQALARPPPAHAPHPPPMPTSSNMGGPYEMEQAQQIQGKMLRLLIQTDIFIRHDGKMNVCAIDWTRIGVEKQPDVSSMFQAMVHLPPALYNDYLPSPTAFADEYTAQYASAEFTNSPDRDRSKPGLEVVAIACSKVLLPNGCQEVIKIAAIDVVTCRILMDHLVCTDGNAPVANWRSDETGLFSWYDIEQARKHGYKVFKGWSAVRAALYKFIDKDTIVVGHNLRSDLDSLRMIHGRAVDIARVSEKRANGPLSKAQLSLDSLCRVFPTLTLKSDPEYGRDVLMNAFAIREMGLWVIKNKDEFEKKVKQLSRDWALIMPKQA